MSRDSAGQIQTRCLWRLLTSSARNIDRCLLLSIDSTPFSAEDVGSGPSKMFLVEFDCSCAPVFPTEGTQSGPGPTFHKNKESCYFSFGLGLWSESPPIPHWLKVSIWFQAWSWSLASFWNQPSFCHNVFTVLFLSLSLHTGLWFCCGWLIALLLN